MELHASVRLDVAGAECQGEHTGRKQRPAIDFG